MANGVVRRKGGKTRVGVYAMRRKTRLSHKDDGDEDWRRSNGKQEQDEYSGDVKRNSCTPKAREGKKVVLFVDI